MPKPLDAATKKQLAIRVNYYREMGIHDFYRRAVEDGPELTLRAVEGVPAAAGSATLPPIIQDKPAALTLIREDIGDCTRCRLHKGRTNLVFGVGNVNADLMFIGEGPGADEDACDTCSPFLMRQIEVIKPKVIVALGAVAAKNLLAMNDSMANLRGRWYDFKDSKLLVTYHPAYLLRDPRQKKEAWKDLQMAMKYLGLNPPKKSDEA